MLSCQSQNNNNDVIRIDPLNFKENGISLSELAQDIIYIRIDNHYPIGLIYAVKIIKKSIYLSTQNTGILVFNRNGRFIRKIGSKGRGPGEYIYCMSFAVDENSETVYVRDKDQTIKVYSKGGKFLKNIPLPKCNDGSHFEEVEIFNSYLFVSQYINMGHAEYSWIIMDTLGNLIKQKKNSIPTFPSRIGSIGGTFKFKDKISYWNLYNDTVFTINPDLSYQPSYLFSPGEYRMPKLKIEFNSIDEFVDKLDKYIEPHLLLETDNYLVYDYYFKKKFVIALIDKETKKTYLSYYNSEGGGFSNEIGGIFNDIDGGLMLHPKYYFTNNHFEYLVGLLDSYHIKAHITNDEFKNSTPKYPEKKKEFEKLAESLKETDNPVLMLVRLKN